jgi:hypothetical protein
MELNASVAATGACGTDDGWLETESNAGRTAESAAGAVTADASGVVTAGAEATGGTLETDVKFWLLACVAEPSRNVTNNVWMKARFSIGRRL